MNSHGSINHRHGEEADTNNSIAPNRVVVFNEGHPVYNVGDNVKHEQTKVCTIRRISGRLMSKQRNLPKMNVLTRVKMNRSAERQLEAVVVIGITIRITKRGSSILDFMVVWTLRRNFLDRSLADSAIST